MDTDSLNATNKNGFIIQPLEYSGLDSVVTSVIKSFISRAKFGQQKYGTNLDRTDLKTLDWIQHAQEEFMDGILYLEKIKQEIQTKEN